METLPAAAQDDSSSANPSSVKSDDSSPRHEGGRGSPPPNCAICLGTCRNKSFTDSCLHQFCFKCLLTWSKVKAVCPLCKQNFRSIIHNVRSNHQYEEYMVDQRPPDDPPDRIDMDSLVTATRRFRYRTTLTLPRRETLAFQQLLMHHYPMVTEVFPPPSTLPRRRSPASFRRSVYRYNLWARPLPDFTGRFRDCTPEFYRYNDSQMHRLVPWLNRELHYLLNENVGHISYVMSRILELLPQYHMNSSEFREAMARYFGERTEHFIHELYCFASTPYDMTGYDRHVQYTTNNRLMTMVNQVISSSESEASVDSDIVMVSSSEPAEPPPGPSRVPAPVYPQNYIPEPSTASNNVIIETISQSDTDDDSSEVMVVGYIKPPQDRTPEVVDLLGSDSDVIVQENTPEQPQNVETLETRPPLLVKLTLKKQTNQTASDSESDDSSYTPPPRSKMWSTNNGNATTSDTSRATPSPAGPETSSRSFSWSSASYSPTSSSDTSSSLTPSSSSSESEESVKRKRRRKNNTEKHKRKRKRPSRSHHKSKKVKRTSSKEKQSKRKSHSGKGVKSSKTKNDASTSKVAEETQPVSEEPSTSGLSKRKRQKRERLNSHRHSNHESKRLKSVVNVVTSFKQENSMSPSCTDTSENQNENESKIPRYNTNNLSTEVGSGLNCENGDDADHTDSDDLPLNLTIVKSLMSSSKM